MKKKLGTQPKISIGIPAFNSEKWIEDTISSLLCQTYANIEIIVSDNASTDNTQSVCEKLAGSDARIKYYRNNVNIGVSNNYNAVFKRSTSNYFKWASSSDILKTNFLEVCMAELLSDEDIALVCTRTLLFENDISSSVEYQCDITADQEKASDRFIHYLNNVALNNIMNGVARRDKLAATGLNKNHLASDINMIAELCLYGKIITVPEYLFFRRQDKKSATRFLSSEEVMRYFKPNSKHPMLLQHWISFKEHFLAMLKAPISFSEKIRISHYILKRMYWDKSYLWHDIKNAFQQLFSKTAR